MYPWNPQSGHNVFTNNYQRKVAPQGAPSGGSGYNYGGNPGSSVGSPVGIGGSFNPSFGNSSVFGGNGSYGTGGMNGMNGMNGFGNSPYALWNGKKVKVKPGVNYSNFGYATDMNGRKNYNMPTYNGQVIGGGVPASGSNTGAANTSATSTGNGTGVSQTDLDAILAQMFGVYGVTPTGTGSAGVTSSTDSTGGTNPLDPNLTVKSISPQFGMASYM